MKKLFTVLAASLLLAPASAQVNGKGTLQFGLGADLGAHATHYAWESHVLGLTLKGSDDDGAVTVTWPIDAQFGLSDRFSLGLCIEPGRYLDSAGTHPNQLFLLSLSPRFYAVNKDHFAMYIHADLGTGFLTIGDVRAGVNRYDDRYSGGHFRLGAAVQWYFGDVFGINLGLMYAAHRLNWRERDPRDQVLDLADYSATLSTSGVLFRIGTQVKF
jgi:hypothetical protein